MIDLIKEINENKFKRGDNYTDFKRGFNRGIDVCEEILDQYNIITAPKTIKLSEIVDRLINELKDYVVRYDNNSDIAIWQNGWCYAVVYIDEDTHNLEFEMQDRFNFPKWLYTLWIAGTKIIDDLVEQEDE